MTTPTPGFPPELETAITEALAEHIEWWHPVAGTSGCLHCPNEKRRFDHGSAKHHSHLAAVVMEVIAQHATTEWGVRWHGCGSDVDETGSEFVSREFVAQGADHGFSDTTVARLVLPWQEVKA